MQPPPIGKNRAVALLIFVVVAGLIVGWLGRLVIPGPNPMSLPLTILVGVGGAVIGGGIGAALFGADSAINFLLAIAAAAAIVVWIEKGRARRANML